LEIPNSDEGTYTVVLFMFTYFVGQSDIFVPEWSQAEREASAKTSLTLLYSPTIKIIYRGQSIEKICDIERRPVQMVLHIQL
jgi:hypothetical protein